MRTLTAEATAEQKKDSYTPFVEVVFKSRDRATTRTYDSTVGVPQVIAVSQVEGRMGGMMSASQVPFPISAIIRLWDPSATLVTTSFIGFRADIGWGINTVANGNEKSEGEPLYVVQQSEASEAGSVFLDLFCASLWDIASAIWADQSRSNPFVWEGTVEVQHILMELFGGAPLEQVGAAFEMLTGTTGAIVGWEANGSAYTSIAAALFDTSTTQSLTTYVDHQGDKLYFGKALRFNRITAHVNQAGVGNWSYTWEYWDGNSWEALTNVSSSKADGENFEALGVYIISFDTPSDWAIVDFDTTDPDDGTSALFPDDMYWIRARQTVSTPTVTTPPIVTRLFAALDFAFSLDSSDATQGSDEVPRIIAQDGLPWRDLIQDVLGFSNLGIILKKDGFHATYIDPAETTTVYDYVIPSDGSNHAALEAQIDIYQVIPNRVTYADLTGGNVGITAADTDSSDVHGPIEVVIWDESVDGADRAKKLAARHLERLQRDKAQGHMTVPMNIGQEVWDFVQVGDSRTGETKKGFVTQIQRTWEPGKYEMKLLLGRVEESITAGSLWDPFRLVNIEIAAAISPELLVRRDLGTLDPETVAAIKANTFNSMSPILLAARERRAEMGVLSPQVVAAIQGGIFQPTPLPGAAPVLSTLLRRRQQERLLAGVIPQGTVQAILTGRPLLSSRLRAIRTQRLTEGVLSPVLVRAILAGTPSGEEEG